jgi:DHA1 family tetracycline resistance protein-like MFS transporter
VILARPKIVRRFLPLYITFFLDGFGLALAYPILTPLFLSAKFNFFSGELSFSLRTVLLGLIISLFPIAQFFGAPLIGEISDQVGRKKILLVTIAGTGIGYFMSSLAIETSSFTFLFISRLWTGFFAGNSMLCLAAIADSCEEQKKRARYFGILAGMGGLGFIFSILFGGLLSDPSLSRYFSPSLPFWVTAIFSTLNFLQVASFFSETLPLPKKKEIRFFHGFSHVKMALKSKKLRPLYAMFFFFMTGWVGTMQFIPAFLYRNYPVGQYTVTQVLFGVGFIWSLANFLIQHWLIRLFHFRKILFVCLGSLSCLLILTLIPLSFSLFIIIVFLGVFCAALSWTNTLTFLSLSAPKNIQGSLLGINQSIGSVASMLGPLLSGIITAYSPHAVFLFTGLTIFCAFCIIFFKKQLEKAKALH